MSVGGKSTAAPQKVSSGITGFDDIADGGLVKGRTTLVSGGSGSGKTVVAMQFLYFGVVERDESGVLLTFDEAPTDLMQNVRSFGWDIPALVKQGRLAIVDATSNPEEEVIHTGPYDLSALIARVEHAVKAVHAKRIVIDALQTLVASHSEHETLGRELKRLFARLRRLGLTVVVTATRDDMTELRERFSADTIVTLRNRRAGHVRHRTVEIAMMRGASHRTGEHTFVIDAARGAVVGPAATEA